MNAKHETLAAGRWYTMTLAEQLAHIGSEVHRARMAQGKQVDRFWNACARAIELFELTLTDTRWKERRTELGRVFELFCDAALGGEDYGSTLEGLEPYFDRFALLNARTA